MDKLWTSLLAVALLSLFPHDASAQITLAGVCPLFTGIPAFSLPDFDGTWFIYRQIPNLSELFPVTCKAVTFTPGSRQFVYSNRVLNKPNIPSIFSTYNNAATNPVLIQGLGKQQLGADSAFNVNWFVVAGDAALTDWAIVRACTNLFFQPGQRAEYAYVLLRTRPVAGTDPASLAAINTALTAQNLGTQLTQLIVHAPC